MNITFWFELHFCPSDMSVRHTFLALTFFIIESNKILRTSLFFVVSLFKDIFVQKLTGFVFHVHSFDRNLHELIFSLEGLFYPCPSDTALFLQTAVTEQSSLNFVSGRATELAELCI